jgi:branched-chain amino acid transport system ATP-binding protein
LNDQIKPEAEGEPLQTLYEGRFLVLHKIAHWEYVRRPRSTGACFVIAVTDERELVLVEQYRYPMGARCIELPAGIIGDSDAFENETPEAAAMRELEEETGFRARSAKTVLMAPTAPGMTSELSHLVRVRGLSRLHSGGGVDGEDITGLTPHELFAKGVLRTFQIAHEFSTLTVRDNLMMVPPGQAGESLIHAWLHPARVRQQEEEIRARANEVLDFLQISHVADELAGNLSGGQKKLLELGRTMMVDAKIVFLDEVGAGVNRTLLNTIGDAIIRLNKERGYTFCMIEHDMDFIGRLCNPVICMAEGKVLAEGTAEEVKNNEEVIEAYLGTGLKNKPLKETV